MIHRMNFPFIIALVALVMGPALVACLASRKADAQKCEDIIFEAGEEA